MSNSRQILFVLIFGVTIYASSYDSENTVTNCKRGFLAAAFLFIFQSLIEQSSGASTTRFSYLLKAVARYAMIYLGILIFILYQRPDDVRDLIKNSFPASYYKRYRTCPFNYDWDCDGPALEDIISSLDYFCKIRFVGWFLATLVIRDAYALHFGSIFLELLKKSWDSRFVFYFEGCWWDYTIVNVLITTTPAVILGFVCFKMVGLQKLDWFGREGKDSIREWGIFRNHRRFSGNILLILVLVSNFFTGYILLNALHINIHSYLVFYRLTVCFLLGWGFVRELYEEITTWGTPERLKNSISNEYRWIYFGIALVEGAISYKFRKDTFHDENAWLKEMRWYKWVPWLIFVVWTLYFYLSLRFNLRKVPHKEEPPKVTKIKL